jgi:hypothetical protein
MIGTGDETTHAELLALVESPAVLMAALADFEPQSPCWHFFSIRVLSMLEHLAMSAVHD